jgi:hypothetical protein
MLVQNIHRLWIRANNAQLAREVHLGDDCGCALGWQFRQRFTWLQRVNFSSHRAAVRAFKVLERKFTASRMWLDNGLHHWLLTFWARFTVKHVRRWSPPFHSVLFCSDLARLTSYLFILRSHPRRTNMRRICSVMLLLFGLTALTMPVVSTAQIISITIAPPELPIYVQPAIPAPGYMWSPGYWAYGPEGYFWVPGTWVLPPSVGFLWTPGYWGWRDGFYVWNAGYWGPHIGFYGGVNYGFGYGGVGYEGGYWNNGVFAYNRAVNNFGGVRITNVYNKTVIVNTSVTRVSFNGGTGGTTAQPTPQEQAAAREQHVAATPAQTQHQQMASTNKALLASTNHGQPAIAATTKPGEFTGKGVVAAREAKPGATLPGTKPTGAAALGTNPSGTRTLEQKGSTGQTHATLNGGTPPKPLNTEAKPPGAAPPLKPLKPTPPQPHLATAPKPHPVVAPHPAAKPGPPPKDKKPG